MYGFLNIEQIKKFQISEFMFKFNRGLLPKVFSTYFVMVSDIHTHLTRSAKDYRVTFSRTNIRSFSIKATGPNIWNDLPSHLRDASNLYSSGAQRPARGSHPARDESSCGPPCLTGKVNISSDVSCSNRHVSGTFGSLTKVAHGVNSVMVALHLLSIESLENHS